MKKNFFLALRLCAFAVCFSSCTPKPDNRVVLYCSVDEVYARPLIKKLEAQTGLQIDALFDTEATKTAGLANRIRAESSRPRADVFWSSALLQTLLLSDEKLLQSYDSPSARDLPARFRGRDWVGVGVRGRVVMAAPGWWGNWASLQDSFNEVAYKRAISNLQFGTASDWATALLARPDGDLPYSHGNRLQFFRSLKQQKVRVFPGNGDVARAVADRVVDLGLTDSDDFLSQKRAGKSVSLVNLQTKNVLVPGAASILAGAPHPQNAQKLLDAIASAQNERALTQEMPGVFSLRRLDEKSNFQSGDTDFSFLMKSPRDDYAKWAATWRKIRDPLNAIFAPK